MVTITWTRTKLKAFKRALREATTDPFTFAGHQFVQSYAKFLIEYLEGRFK